MLFVGMCVFENIIVFTIDISKKAKPTNIYSAKYARLVFCVSFISLSLYYLIINYFGYFPGMLTSDSVQQIDQLFTGDYINHHPICSTLLIKVFVDISLLFSSNLQFGIFLFICFQTIIFSAVASYGIKTIYEISRN